MADLQVSQAIAYIEVRQESLSVAQTIAYIEVEQKSLQASQAIAYVEVGEFPSVSLNTLLLQSFAQNITIDTDLIVSVDTLLLLSSLPSAVISPSSVSIPVNSLILSGLANDITVQIGASFITLSELILLANVQTITISTTTGRKYGPALQ